VFARGKGRKHPHTRRVVDELGRSYGHLRLAVGHAADGATSHLGSMRSTTRNALTPLYDQIREGGFRRGRPMRQSKSRWGLVGLLAAGAAVGAMGAMFARRRRTASQWNQYEPGIDDIGFADGGQDADGPLAATTKKVAAGAAAVAESVSTQAGKIAETLHEKTATGSAGGSTGPGAGPTGMGPGGTSFSPTAAARTAAASTPGASARSTSPSGKSTSDPTPGETDESRRTLAGRSAGRGPFASFSTSDEPGGTSNP
jgi:hypothetical protein